MAELSEAARADVRLAEDEMIKRGLFAIKRLPISRRVKHVTPPPILRDLLKLLQAYLDSPSHYAPPLKSLLFDAVQSLLPQKKTALSTQWTKTHLCLVLKKWVISALRLATYNDQPQLMVMIMRNPSNTKDPKSKVFLQTDNPGETLTFYVASPSPNLAARGATGAEGSPASPSAKPLSPSSLMPDDFMDEIDLLATETSMMEFPTILYTPGVPSSAERLDPSSPDTHGNGAGHVAGLGRS